MQASNAEPVEVAEAKPVVVKRGSKKGQENGKSVNGKSVKRSTRNTIGRIIPGDDSASEDEDDGEGNSLYISSVLGWWIWEVKLHLVGVIISGII